MKKLILASILSFVTLLSCSVKDNDNFVELKQDSDYETLSYNEIGGKTGTTNNASDGWYMGITHNLVTGVWVGGDERSIHFPSWDFGQGARSARPIWDKFMALRLH